MQRYAAELSDDGESAASINQSLSAIRKLAGEAADNGALDNQIASGIKAVKGVRQEGTRTGNWLTKQDAQDAQCPRHRHAQGTARQSILAVLIECGLRRAEVANLAFDHIQQRDGRWVLVDLIGKRNKV